MQMMNWYAEQEKVDLFTARKRRTIENEHRREIEKMIEERKVARQLEREAEDAAWKEWLKEEELRQVLFQNSNKFITSKS